MPELPYTHKSYLHEPLTFMSYLAGITRKLQLVTAILILPQRQTALVAKQAAEVDVLSGGRLRLGIGVGWNPVEYEALGENFHNRGRRCEEQITVLRALWTQEVVQFKGEWHQISHAGLNPLPVQRPIPIWIGAGRSAQPIPPEVALRRIGRLADGWFPMFSPSDAGQEAITRMRTYAREAGRDPVAIGIEGRVSLASQDPRIGVPRCRPGRRWELPISRSEPTEVRSARRRSTSTPYGDSRRLWPRESRICRDNSCARRWWAAIHNRIG